MSYKARFRPSEALSGGIWRVLAEHAEEPAVAGAALSTVQA
jgi:arginyl-tRNA--protein-N-Asp/Glu arginylyltransferase